MQAKVIYSGGEDLDILPQHASKGKGLEFLLGEVSTALSTLFGTHTNDCLPVIGPVPARPGTY